MRTQQSPWSGFVRIWFATLFSYVLLKVAFNLAVMSWIDLRWEFLLEILVVPFGQAIVLWAVARRAAPASGDASQTIP